MTPKIPDDSQLLPRRDFFLRAQQGICCLRRTWACQDVNGLMEPRARRSPRYATWDHIKPRGQGGQTPFNVLLACAECNRDRGNGLECADLARVAAVLWQAWQEHIAKFGPQPNPKKRAKKERAKRAKAFKTLGVVDLTMDVEDDVARRERREARANTLKVTNPSYRPGRKAGLWSLDDERALTQRIRARRLST